MAEAPHCVVQLLHHSPAHLLTNLPIYLPTHVLTHLLIHEVLRLLIHFLSHGLMLDWSLCSPSQLHGLLMRVSAECELLWLSSRSTVMPEPLQVGGCELCLSCC